MDTRPVGMRWSAVIALLGSLASMPALAQVTQQQQSAIRGSCRSDFMSNCSGVTPGGKEALQCLQRNVEKLSPACKTAVSATIPAAPAAPAPPPPPAPAAAAPPPPAPVAAPAAPPPPPAVAQPAAKPAPASTPSTPRAAPAPKPAVAATPPASAPAAAPAPPPPPATLRQATVPELLTVRRRCSTDIEVHCRSVPPGDGRIVTCLAAQEPALSPGCKGALAPLKN